MANYIHNKIVCTKEILDKYFLDYIPFDNIERLNKPYITFNKIFNVKNIIDYSPNIYYGYGFTYHKNKDNMYEIKFFTRWLYPIEAIIKSIEMGKKDIIWYACEGNMKTVSKFYWKGKKVCEDILDLTKTDYEEWYTKNIEKGKMVYEYPESSIWLFKPEEIKKWKTSEIKDLRKKYLTKYADNITRNLR